VIYDGRLVADADPATITPEELGSAMTGAASGHLEHVEEEAAPEDEAR
jgi:simple sugar transport system ATP-binding protein